MGDSSDLLDRLLRHQEWAGQIARRLALNDSEADELLQRGWFAAVRNPPAEDRGLKAWFRKLLLNQERQARRNQDVRRRHELASGLVTEVEAPVDEIGR